MNSHSSTPSYLIVCFRFMGDVLVTTPLALSIKTQYPNATVDYLVFKGTEAILAKNPCVRKVITVPRDTRGLATLMSLYKKYDVAIAAYPSDRTAMAAALTGKKAVGLTYGWKKEWWKHLLFDVHNVCYDYNHVVSNMLMPLRMLGIEPVPRVVMGYDDSDMAYARENVPFERYIIFHPYSMKDYKYWSVEKWANLAALIQRHTDCSVVFTRTPEPEGNRYLEKILAIAPKETNVISTPCTLNELAAIIQGATAFIGIDTAITHVAAALDIPTIAIFGPTLTRYWAPWPNECLDPSPFAANKGIQRNGCVTVVQKDWECVPCNKEACRISRCGAIECLEELAVEEVFGEVMAVLENNAVNRKVE